MSMLVDVSYFISGPRQIRNATTAKMPTAEGHFPPTMSFTGISVLFNGNS